MKPPRAHPTPSKRGKSKTRAHFQEPAASLLMAGGASVRPQPPNPSHQQHTHLQEALTEQQRLRKELASQARCLAEAQRIAGIGSWELRLADDQLTWTDEVFRMTGIQRGQFGGTGRWFRSLIPAEDREAVCAARQRCLATGSRFEVEHRIIRPDGGIRHLYERAELILDETGAPLTLAGTVQDLTEIHHARQQLRDSEHRFTVVAAITTDAVWDWDLKRGSIWWSAGLASAFGHCPQTLGASLEAWTALIHPNHRQRVVDSLHRVIQGDSEDWCEEYPFRRQNGEYARVLDRGRVIRDATGQAVRMVGGMKDLTEYRLLEERLRRQASLLDQAHDAILVRDLQHRITYWNRSATRLYGWSAEEALGKRVSDLIYNDQSSFQEATRKVIEQGEWQGELRQVNRRGEEVLVQARWTLLSGSENEAPAILAINTDITEKKRLEERFLRAQRLESIGTLAGGIAHDLNNILSPIVMGVDLLKLAVHDERSRAMLAALESGSRRGVEMVRQLLLYARGVEGQRLPVDLNRVTQDVRHIIQETFPRDIRLSIHLPAGLPCPMGDATQIHQVLLNLCVNARDAMPRGGRLEIRAVTVDLDDSYAAMDPLARPGRHVVISVSDNGEGIPPETRKKMFDPFFTTKASGKGTGLGLSTVLAIVKGHGGFIHVGEGDGGRGTVFEVFLPAREVAPPRVIEEGNDEPPRGRGELILVADDEEPVRLILQQTLEEFGYRVLTATDGAEAVAVHAAKQAEIKLVLTDMMMPVMDGTAVIQAVARINPAVKIIAASGLTTSSNALRHAAVGEFIAKPYTSRTVLEAIRRQLEAP